MPKSANQKLKLLYLMQYLLQKSDEEHPISIQQMIDELARHDIKAERKTLYDDMEALRLFGLDIIQARGKTTGYYIGKTVTEFCSLAEATGTAFGDVETVRYERRDLPGAVLFSLLGPDCLDCLHAQLFVGIDDHLQQMRVQISNVNSQNRAKYKKMAMDIFDHIRADKPVTLLEELDAKKYISMSDGSKTISEWNGLIQEYIDHIGIARDILQNAIVNSFASNPVTGFEKLKKDIRQMLKNISGEVDK